MRERLFPCVVSLSDVNLGDAHPQLLCRPARNLLPGIFLTFPQSHKHFHVAVPSDKLSARLSTDNLPNLSPIMFISAI